MIEKVGSQNIYVRNYTSNFAVKEFIQDVLMPRAFPNIPMNKLNLGLTGIASEMIGQGIEDAYGTASLMMNESFITRAVLPNSIYLIWDISLPNHHNVILRFKYGLTIF